ncbi:MAG: RagB/SusD family nutrient uptake outer membrane protein, partial [Prevotella sp.]|nr:RagB/SusD family nutrient uptake outer membrane protein [Prevotella sp.]
ACRYAINDGSKTENIPSTKDILYEGGGPNWSGRVPAFDGKIYRWGAGSEYGSWLFRVYEYFEYSDKIAGIGWVHIIYQPFTAEETLLCRAEAELYLGQSDKAIQDLEFWTASKQIDAPLTQEKIDNKYKGTPESNIWVNDMHPQQMSSQFKVLNEQETNVLNCILHFRRIETMFEGLRWFDIKRYGITVHHAYRGPVEDEIHHDYLQWNDPRRVLQIPNNVIAAGYPSTDRTQTLPDQSSVMTSNPILAE